MKRILTTIAAVTLSVVGVAGSAQAQDYPAPPTTPPPSVAPPTTLPPILPPTGSTIDQTLLLGGAVLVVGAGLVIGVRQRRRPVDA